MATAAQQTLYQCDRCGTPEIVAVPLLYQQGTRSYSGTFSRGTSQSQSALAASPPHPRGYMKSCFLWVCAVFIFFIWGFAGFSSIYEHPKTTAMSANSVILFVAL